MAKKNSIFSVVVETVNTLEGLQPKKGAMVIYEGVLKLGNGTAWVDVNCA